MDTRSKHEMNEYYSGLLKEHGDNLLSLCYRDSIQQLKRFALLTDIGDILRTDSVLDVGCGLGHLVQYLRKWGWEGVYTGLDINHDMVMAAQKKFPKDHFFNIDILTDSFYGEYDHVFCGAAIQHKPKYDDTWEYLEKMVDKMFSLASKTLSFDVFSENADYKEDHNLYVDPHELFKLCYSLTPRVVIRNDYRPYEIMAYLYKNTEKDEFNIFKDWHFTIPKIV